MTEHVRAEDRYLTDDERTLVDRSRIPAVRELSAPELSGLLRELRDRQHRTRELATKRRLDAGDGLKPAGSTRKGEALTAAIKRVQTEVNRRRKHHPSPAGSTSSDVQA